MRTILLLTVLLLALSACTTKANRTAPVEVPEPLQTGNSYSELKRGRYTDLVDQLYADLRQLDARLEQLDEQKRDSTAAYSTFDDQNESYYAAAERRAGALSDSVLRVQVLAIVKQSSQRYSGITSRHENLQSTLNQKARAIEDSHEALKVLLTLPVMQQYQKEHLPSTRAMEDLLREMEGLQKEVDALKKKHGVQ